MKLTKHSAGKQVFRQFSLKLQPLGFKEISEEQLFRQQLSFGFREVSLSFGRGPDAIGVNMGLGIRVDKVEDLINIERPQLSYERKLSSLTIALDIGHIVSFDRKISWTETNWAIFNQEEIPQTIESMYQCFLQYGLSYLQIHSDLEKVLETLSDNTRWGWVNCLPHFRRCQRAVALAKILNKDQPSLHTLITRCQSFLKSQISPDAEPDLWEFNRFVERVGAIQ